MTDLDLVYGTRFDEADRTAKMALWREIVPSIGRIVPLDGPVLDLACDRGYFVAHVAASERWACDVRDVAADLPTGVRFVRVSGLALDDVAPAAHFATVFTSNYLEHLGSPDEVVEQMRVVARLLRPGGRFVVLQPNIRLVGGAYWDFIDHRVPLTERSLQEAGALAGLATERTIVRYLPFSTKGRLPQDPRLVRAYLRFRPAWRLLGRQTLWIGRKPG
jgi:SAM-dependent methyltransferase